MVSSTIDHMVALTIFIAATLLFIGLFNQTISTAFVYQNHRATATKASDLLDNMLLNPGIPNKWGRNMDSPTGFGVQDPEFTQYEMDTFSLMHLESAGSSSVYYSKANNGNGMYFNNLSTGFGGSLLMPQSTILNYSTAQKLLGTNGTYGFQLTIKPIITVTVTETQSSNPLILSIHAEGTGFPLANAQISYKLFLETINGGQYSGYQVINGTAVTNVQGSTQLFFDQVTSSTLSYAFVASVHLSGVNGVGYSIRDPLREKYVIPIVENLTENKILVAHSDDIINFGQQMVPSTVSYNARMVTFNSQDFTLQDGYLHNSSSTIMNGALNPYGEVTILDKVGGQNTGALSPGILVLSYNDTASQGGFVVMPWGISALAYPIVFGGDPSIQEWVSTDIRQVTVNGVAYQAKLAIWSYQGYQVKG